ncbi:MAG: acetyltransferase [Rhodocyclales bacterium]|nr:acetyltransferase [Rhodocyclales bacterium]
MPTDTVHVLGAGGHGRVVIDALQLLGYPNHAIRVRDDRYELHGTTMLGCAVEAPTLQPKGLSGRVHAAVGSAQVRQFLLEGSGLPRDRWLTIAHPRACVALSASLGPGTLVAALAVVGPCAHLDSGVIVNHGAVVDHDCQVGAYTHIAPSASLSGGVRVGARVLIGAGARILPGVRIGDDAVIGAGAVVLTEVPPGQTWTGIPARHAIKESK